jgi:hypothetical protein
MPLLFLNGLKVFEIENTKAQCDEGHHLQETQETPGGV